MIDDKLERFATAQAVTSQAVSTNSYNLTALRDIARGRPVKVRHKVTTTVTSGDGATHVDIEMIEATNAALTTGVAVLAGGTIRVAIADLVANADFVQTIPVNKMTKQHFGIRFTPVAGTFNAGAFDSHLIDGTQDHPA